MDTFGAQGRKALGGSLETLSGFRARRARETRVRGGRGCKSSIFLLKPEGPEIEKNSFSLAREEKKKTIPPRTKEPFSLEIFILGIEIFILD